VPRPTCLGIRDADGAKKVRAGDGVELAERSRSPRDLRGITSGAKRVCSSRKFEGETRNLGSFIAQGKGKRALRFSGPAEHKAMAVGSKKAATRSTGCGPEEEG